MIEELISKALQGALIERIENDYPIQALGNTLDIENRGDKWIEFVQIKNNRKGDFWGESNVYQGTFRVLLHWPLNNEGDYEPVRYLDALSTFFKNGTLLRKENITVKIYQNPDLGSTIDTSGERIFPLSLSYRCFEPSE